MTARSMLQKDSQDHSKVSQKQIWESLSHYLKDDLSFTISGVTLHQCQILPGADRDSAVHKGDRNKGRHDQGMNMG